MKKDTKPFGGPVPRKCAVPIARRLLPMLLWSLFALSTHSQPAMCTVTGLVTDAAGQPVPGVNVSVQGTPAHGTVTDMQGRYLLANVPEGAVLLFSFIGFEPHREAVGIRTAIDVALREAAVGLDEVVAVGFGTQKKVNLTGSVGSLEGEALEQRPVRQTAQMLQGLVPGLIVTQSSGGSLESSPGISIRGTGTIGEGSTGSPLVLIDGVEGDLNAINPQDIEAISVLKDAASSALYGSRAPFGVILVTTRQGKAGKAHATYQNSFRWNAPINMPHMMDSYTFALYFNDANTNGGSGPFFSDGHLQRILDYQNGTLKASVPVNPNNPQYWADGYAYGNANTDWYDALYRDHAFAQEHNVSVSGGNEGVRYYFSGNYLDQNGLMVFNQDAFDRYTLTSKINARLGNMAEFATSTRFVREDFGRPSSLSDSFFQDLARQGWPTLPLYDPNGHLYSSPSPALNLRDGGRDKSQKDWLTQQVQLVLTPAEGLKLTGELNYRTMTRFRHWDVLQTYNHDVDGSPYVYRSDSHVYEYGYKENFLNPNLYAGYGKEVKGHAFKLLAGFQSEELHYRDLSARRDGIVVASITALNATSGTDANGNTVAPEVSGQYQEWATAGFFGRLNYDYMGRYLFEANLRYDGTSRYREDKRWNWFPSASAGWNLAREGFWEPWQHVVPTLKLRASYGQLGNQNTDNWYPTYPTMPVGTADGAWLTGGVKPNTSSAPGLVSQRLSWERVRNWNVGLDVGAFGNRLTGSLDRFVRYTDDMIGPAPELPALLGTSVPKTNNTDLKTYGFELSLQWRDKLANGLGYRVGAQLSDSQTEITRYPNATGNLGTYRKGQKLGEIWGYETAGIARTQAAMDTHLASLPNGGQNALGSQWEAGDIMYRDLNGDGCIDNGAYTLADHGDLKIIGNSTPRYLFSVELGADYKGFDLRAFFQGVLKRDYFQNSYYFWGAYSGGIWWSTGFEEHKDYFRDDASHPLGQNLDAYYPRPLFGNAKNQQAQTRYLQDASYLRLKNLQLGYTLPKHLSARLKAESLRVYVSGENLHTWTRMSGIFDPETIGGGSGGNVYPLSRVLAVGISVGF
ncbi:MAG: TonB-dependent receptor [Breznakibacter sp.]